LVDLDQAPVVSDAEARDRSQHRVLDVEVLAVTAQGHVGATALTFGTLALLSLAWLALGVLVRRGRTTVPTMLVVGALWTAPLAVGPPLFSPDVYAYTAIGASVHHGVDPYVEGPGAAGDIPAVRGAEPFWRFSPTPYTPPFLNLIAGISWLADERLLAVVVVLRLMAVIAVAVAVAALVRLARLCGQDPRVAVWLGAVNPLLLLNGVSAAHNDVLMMALVLPGVVLAVRGRPLPGILLCSAAAGVKSVALAAVLCIGVDYAVRQDGWAARLRALLVSGLVGAGSFALLVQLSGRGWRWVENLSVPGIALEPLTPTTAIAFVLDPVNAPIDQMRILGAVASVVLVLVLLTRLPRWGLVRVTGAVFLVLVALSPVVWPWYFLWPLLLFAAVAGRRLAPFVVVLSIALLAITLPGGQPTLPLLGRPTADWLVLAVLAGLLVLGAAAAGADRRSRRGSAPPMQALRAPLTDAEPAAAGRASALPPASRLVTNPGPHLFGRSALRVLVVCPTYNEVENVTGHVEAVLVQPLALEVLVVDDSSPDGTGAAVRALAADHPGRVHLLERPGKQGLGRAYVAGFGWALERGGYDVVAQMDVDGSHDPSALGGLVQATVDADLVLGSRYCPGGRVADWPWRRRALSRYGNRYAQLVLGVPVRDLTGGYKAWRIAVLEALDVQHLASDGYAFQIETTFAVLRRGGRVVEVPITFRDRLRGESKMHPDIAREAVVAVWRMRRRAMTTPAESLVESSLTTGR
jgi:alpha-1,6-mannosyltransferase